MKQRRKIAAGFTIIDMLIALAVFGVITLSAAPFYLKQIANAENTVSRETMRTVRK